MRRGATPSTIRPDGGELFPALFQWAKLNATHIHTSIPLVDDLLADGWEIIRTHPQFPQSVLMRKAVIDE